MNRVKILFIGDIVGKPGRKAVQAALPRLKSGYDLIIANVENAAAGFGLTEKVYRELLDMGIRVFTSGNHIWDKKEIVEKIDNYTQLIRPANYPAGVPGSGYLVETVNGVRIGVMNLIGRIFMGNYDCPFRSSEAIIDEMRKQTPIVVLDFHAETTSEKTAMGWYVDGKISGLIGTHTHVQTADERILPGGTAYISDAGMTGARDGCIGVDRDIIIDRFLTAMPKKFEPATGPMLFNAVQLEIDTTTGKAISISRIKEEIEAIP